MSRSGTIVLNYKNVTVLRTIAGGDDKIVIETFSGESASPTDLADLPQYPVAKSAEDTIEVTRAADGSGTVTFELEGNDVADGSSSGTRLRASPPVSLRTMCVT